MSDRSVLEEAFAMLLVNESIFTDSCLTASLKNHKFRNMKDLRLVNEHFFRQISDEDCAFMDNSRGKNELDRSLSDTGVFSTKRRSKSGTTSPDHKRRKSVTFADSNGGDLVQVREFDNNVDPIQNCLSDRMRSNSDACCARYLLLFPQPCANYSAFMRKLFTQKICLENAQIISGDVLIGTVKVQNMAFEKQVHLRVTMDSWKSFSDVEAKFLHSESGEVDVFTFSVQIPPGIAGVKFCIRYGCLGAEYWDNNDGSNYCVAARESNGGNNGRNLR